MSEKQAVRTRRQSQNAGNPPEKTPIANAVATIPSAAPGANDPDFAKLQQAANARKQGLIPLARETLAEVIKRRPGWPPVRRELIMLHIAAEEFAEAEALLLPETRRTAKDRWVWMTLGLARSRIGNSKGEIECLGKALEIEFDTLPARRMFELQRDTQDFAGALDTVALLRRKEDSEVLAVAHAQLLARLNRRNEALIACEQLMDRVPAPGAAVEQWVALYLAERNDPLPVIEMFEKKIAAGRTEPVFYHGLSRGLHRADRNTEAIAALHTALKGEPNQLQWWYDLSVLQRQMGDVPASQQSLEHAITLDPMNATALRVFGVEHKHVYDELPTRRLNVALASVDRFKPEKKVELHFAVAKAREDVGELEAAFGHYETAGRLQAQLTPYRHAASEGLLKLLRLNTSRATYERAKDLGSPSHKPVFVLGMPRSGTTLAEQIIASHPEAHGAGELKLLHRVLDGVVINGKPIQTGDQQGNIPTYIPGVDLTCTGLSLRERGDRYVQALDALARAAGIPAAKRVVDKMPGNYYWSGTIPFILPQARLVHTRRHPVDTCVSIYRIFFPDGMPWSYNQIDLGKVYRSYHEHMKHWETTLPEGFMISVVYERVVADVEREARRIIAHIGLEWNDACLKFYETERPVKTASLSQVRQPIYNSSVGRWKKYEAYLKPLLNELGPLVREYEDELAAASGSA
jgi:tetratricopeptide (TPR) repeat protein